MFESTFILFIPKEEITSDKTEVKFGVFSNNELIETYKTSFVGPWNSGQFQWHPALAKEMKPKMIV